jgi:hypothetical protein
MKLPSLKYLISEGFINLMSISLNENNSAYLLGMDSTNMHNRFGFDNDYCVGMFPAHMEEEKQLKNDESFCSKYITTLNWENGASKYIRF